MLAKTNRIPRATFTGVFSTGKRLHSPVAQLVYTPALSPAFSVVVSKKVAKKAVDRNRLRRRVYGVVEWCLRENEIPHQGIFILKPGALTTPRLKLKAEITSLLAQISKSR